MPTPTLDSLEASLLQVDRDFDTTDQLNGLSFHKTLHNTLGFTDHRDFSVFLPWKQWSEPLKCTADEKTNSSHSALQEAFKDVLSQGQRKDKCFIDFAHLWDGNEFPFFGEGNNDTTDNATKTVAKAIADVIEQFEGSDTEIVVRFITGHDKVNKKEAKELVQKIFWPKDDKPLVTTKKKATFYLGLYSPVYDLNVDEKPIALLQSQAETIRAFAALLKDNLKMEIPILEQLATQISSLSKDTVMGWLEKQTRSLSWNHGKILAVNGVSLLTGGANFAWTSASDQYTIVEQSCKIKGDAAVSAHAWQDYFFKYLNKPHPSDTFSFVSSINLADDTKTYPWKDSDRVPISKAAPFSIEQTASQGVKVLCTAQLGDWHGKATELDYPVQIVQLIKDLVSNIVWGYLAKTDSLIKDPNYKERIMHLPLRGAAVAIVDMFFTEQKALRDAFGKAIFPKQPLENPYKKLRINPNAWASRTTRLNAIANATKSVILCQQRLILPPFNDIEPVVKKINEKMKENMKTEESQSWRGTLWPFDLLIAICYAIMPSSRSRLTNSWDVDSANVYIVLSNFKVDRKGDGGWADEMEFKEFISRLKTVMRGIALLANLPTIAEYLPQQQGKPLVTADQATQLKAASHLFGKGLDFDTLGPKEATTRAWNALWGTADLFTEYDELVDRKVHVRRVLKGHEFDKPDENAKGAKPIANHCKIVCVDDAVMYIGSDNAYPEYNEQHGAWIEDRDTIQQWKNKFWNEMWGKRSEESAVIESRPPKPETVVPPKES